MLHHRSGGRVPTTCADCFGISFSFGCTSGCSPLVCASSMLPASHIQVEMSGAADLSAGAQQVCVPFGACSGHIHWNRFCISFFLAVLLAALPWLAPPVCSLRPTCRWR